MDFPRLRNQWALLLVLGTGAASTAAAQSPAQRQLTREIYQELVEINTTASSGDTLQAAQAMAARLIAGGLSAADVQVLQSAPKRGNLVARFRGTGRQRPLLLVAHLDVVEARREDWHTDPFKLIEQDGYYYGRGTGDDKYMAAAFVANLIRYRQENYRPDRDLILLLETDEEGADEHKLGMRWVLEHHRPLIDAELALNEGGGVAVRDGKPVWNTVQTSEKLYQDFWLEAHNRGGHSSQPRRDNAIYELSAALAKLAQYEFPLEFNATTRLYFERMSALETGQTAADMKAILAPVPDAAALVRLSALPPYNAQLRTTCIATRLAGGHADNALPQQARAMLNCRILPGHSADETRQQLIRIVANDQITVTAEVADTPSSPSPLDPRVLKPIEQLTQKFWPGIPVLPFMGAGATDSRFLRNAGIASYGHSGLASDIFDNRAHGQDERVSVKAFREGQEYLYQLVKLIGGGR
jgi:acetylornithine deacetylase/succinyl-diaminopimelate desuccinylase-like protein